MAGWAVGTDSTKKHRVGNSIGFIQQIIHSAGNESYRIGIENLGKVSKRHYTRIQKFQMSIL